MSECETFLGRAGYALDDFMTKKQKQRLKKLPSVLLKCNECGRELQPNEACKPCSYNYPG